MKSVTSLCSLGQIFRITMATTTGGSTDHTAMQSTSLMSRDDIRMGGWGGRHYLLDTAQVRATSASAIPLP